MSFISHVWRFLPLIVVILAFLAARFEKLFVVDTDLLNSAPYLLACVLLGFAAMFNRSRFITPVLVALFGYFFIHQRLQVAASSSEFMALFTGLNLVFCLLLIISSCWPEKGLFNRHGFSLVSLLVLAAIMFWFFSESELWLSWLHSLERYIASFRLIDLEAYARLNQTVLVVHVFTLGLLLCFSIFRRSVADFALLLSWLCAALVFFNFSVVNISAACYSALFLGLIILYQQSNYQVTYKDALTGISGRRALDDYLSTLGRRYAIAMLDVDHFKKFNDTYGHEIGDQVLKMVAAKIDQIEGGGKAFRYGGEEFTIVFNRKEAKDSFVFLEAVRTSIEHYAMALRSEYREPSKKSGKAQRGKTKAQKPKTVSVTISIGVADSHPGLSPKDILKAADSVLYKAKQKGRNCTVMA